MQRTALKAGCTLTIIIAGMLAIGPASADKPSWAGGEKGERNEHRDRPGHNKGRQHNGEQRSSHGNPAPAVSVNVHFGSHHRTVARDYYSEQFRKGHCPPGLAKKNNGCLPPGQAKKWAVGQPLPRQLVYYELPSTLIVQLGQPRAGHRYVRVAIDILLIAIGTGIVVDAIQDLGRM